MKSPLLPLLLSGIFFLSTSLGHTEDDFPLRDAKELSVRGGIPNILKKLHSDSDEELRIAYLGGSITAAAGWRVKTLEWLKERYPNKNLSEIHAAIGGTGSDLGVFRLEQDVLRHDPDFLFVEFAVNDGGAPPERIHKAMEGIVRQTWKADPEIDIVFVYTLSQPQLADLQNGKFYRSASAMEELADHYDIPTIHMAMEVAAREKDGTLIFKGEKPTGDEPDDAPLVFSTDGVHPLVETGHELYLEAVARSWEKLEEAGSEAKPHEVGTPFREDNWEAAKIVPITEDLLSGGWEKVDSGENGNTIAKRFSKRMPEMWLAKEPGASLSFQFKGKEVSIYDILGPDGGRISIKLNDKDERFVNRIDGYCTYHRLSKMGVGGDETDEVQSVTLTLTDEKLDKREILFEKNRDDFDKNPERYSDHVWHAGSIMIIGNIVK